MVATPKSFLNPFSFSIRLPVAIPVATEVTVRKKLLNQLREAYLRPYVDLFNLDTKGWLVVKEQLWLYPWGMLTNFLH